MKVAIYYPWVYLYGGPERVLSQVLAHTRHDWTVLTNRYEPDATFPSLREAKMVELSTVSVKRTFFDVARAAFRIATQRLPLENQDLLVIFCEGLGDMLLFRNADLPVVCLCFTPLRAAFDSCYQEAYLDMKGQRLLRSICLHVGAFLFRMLDRRLWTRYSKVIAISEEVRKRIEAGGLRAAKDVDILYPGVEIASLSPVPVYEKRFLIAGRIMWTKNIELGIRAFQRLLERRPDLSDFSLTIAGYVDRKSKPYYKQLQDLAAATPQIDFVLNPSDAELFSRSQNAYAVLYTPFNEDYGLIPLEMMALEKPVIAVNRGGPRETIVDGVTGFLTEPTPEAFASAMERLADDPALVRTLGIQARRRAKQFDTPAFCEKLDSYLDDIAEGRNPVQREFAPAATAHQ